LKSIITVDKKTGFKALSDFTLYDSKGIEFYNNNFTNSFNHKGLLTFNVPRGTYKVLGFIEKLDKPINYSTLKLPKKERNWVKKNFNVFFVNNKNKCSINRLTGNIYFDHRFKKAPKYILFDILCHEFGHQYYETEHYADMYATNMMLNLGFNPSQIGKSLIITLTQPNNYYRKNKVVNHLKNTKRL